jgi:hypothetical protein
MNLNSLVEKTTSELGIRVDPEPQQFPENPNQAFQNI